MQKKNIKCFAWLPTFKLLALCTGNKHLYFVGQDGTTVLEIPFENFNIHKIEWSPDGKSILLFDKVYFIQSRKIFKNY